MTDGTRPFRATLLATFAAALGCAFLDVTLAALRSSEATPLGAWLGALVCAVGLYGAVAAVVGTLAGLTVDAILALIPVEQWRAARRRLGDDPARDREVAGGVWAAGGAAGVLALVVMTFLRVAALEMQNKRNAALSTALVAAAALPACALAWFPLQRITRRLVVVLPRPRTLWALGAIVAVGLVGVVAAVLSVDWRIINFGPEVAALGFALLAVGHAWMWYGRRGTRLRERLSPTVRRGLAAALAVAIAGSALYAWTRFGTDARATALVADECAGARSLLLAARRLSDHDHDGFSARLGGGDCDDHDDQVHPGADDHPGDGKDQDCSGSDAQVVTVAATPRRSEPLRSAAAQRFHWDGNLLVVTVDTLRADRLDAKHMPNLARLAERAVVFTHAYAQAPNTPRSFPSFLTSRYPSQVHWQKEYANFSPIEADNLTFFEAIKKSAQDKIHTVGEFSHFYLKPENGIAQGFDEWDDGGALTLHDSNTDVAGPRITPRVVGKLAAMAKSRQRFVLWTHYFEPHSRYMDHPEFPSHSAGLKGLEEKYDGEVAFVDRELGKVLDALHASGLDQTTAIVVFADHGESFGEHRVGGSPMYFHGETIYDEVLRVPLVVAVPGVAPRKIDDRVELVDLGPTLVELEGAPVPPSFVGRSLLGAMLGDALPATPVWAELLPCPSWNHSWRAYVSPEGRKLIYKISENTVEMYDLAADPTEQHNLAQRDVSDAGRLKESLLAFMSGLKQAAEGAHASLDPAQPVPSPTRSP